MSLFISLPLAAAVVFGILFSIGRGAKNFEARRIAEGAWGPDGPLRPTDAPLGWLGAPRGEIFGAWVFKNRRKWFGSGDAAPFKSVSAEKRKKRRASKDSSRDS
jgi:hypothetical protein